jgi:hypothetical protein
MDLPTSATSYSGSVLVDTLPRVSGSATQGQDQARTKAKGQVQTLAPALVLAPGQASNSGQTPMKGLAKTSVTNVKTEGLLYAGRLGPSVLSVQTKQM